MTTDDIQKRLQPLHARLGYPKAVALVVAGNEANATGRVRFSARFPVRREVGVQPVTVYAETSEVVPSRLVESVLMEDTELPEGRVWWSLVLEFAVTNLVEARPYLALYAASPESRSADTAFWDSLPMLHASVTEYPLPQL